MNLLVAVPTHSRTITISTAITLLELQKQCAQRINMQVVFHSSSVISDLRNVIVADFLARKADILFMLDADQGMPASMILRMIETGHPLVGCLYPRRNYFWQNAAAMPLSDDINKTLYRAMRFVGNLVLDESGNIAVVNGFAQASHIGGGAMMIHRSVFTTMMTRYPELAGIGFSNEDENRHLSAYNWGFFNPIIDRESGRHLGEDISFCERWRKGCGGVIWANVDESNEHAGNVLFRGNYIDYLNAHSG
ncbi:MAG: hypothetical protein HGB00_05420 [Chlorobiaceae bacterium]|nr:hypothetical protein [Chlorobiaceae bacterium]